MDESDEKFVFPQDPQGQRNGLLDRIDRALANAGLAVWRCIVDGFAAYGAAECGLPLDPAYERKKDWEAEILHGDAYSFSYGPVDDHELRSDYADIDELIRALQSVGEERPQARSRGREKPGTHDCSQSIAPAWSVHLTNSPSGCGSRCSAIRYRPGSRRDRAAASSAECNGLPTTSDTPALLSTTASTSSAEAVSRIGSSGATSCSFAASASARDVGTRLPISNASNCGRLVLSVRRT